MIYREEPGSLFDVPREYTLVHCISKDCAMGVGIAKEFVNHYPDLKEYCRVAIVNYRNQDVKTIGYLSSNRGFNDVINLVTKDRYWQKPTYKRLRECLIGLRERCDNQTKLAMPRIGCGYDRKDWNKVSAMIQDVFKDTDVEILIRTN